MIEKIVKPARVIISLGRNNFKLIIYFALIKQCADVWRSKTPQNI
jgi:hypothetical protein